MNKNQLPSLIAHRGLSKLAPENTMAAFEKAHDMGFKWLEFDVMLSKDDVPIIFHDETLNRTANGKGRVADKNYKQLKVFNAGKKFRIHEPIPSLEEVLLFMKKYHLYAVVEIKPTVGRDVITAKKTIQLIEKIWPEGLKHVIFASFSLASLITVRSLLPKQAIGFGLDKWGKDWQELVKSLNCLSIHVNQRILTPARISVLKQTKCHLLAYTVNTQKNAQKLAKWGVDGFFSDCPHRL